MKRESFLEIKEGDTVYIKRDKELGKAKVLNIYLCKGVELAELKNRNGIKWVVELSELEVGEKEH